MARVRSASPRPAASSRLLADLALGLLLALAAGAWLWHLTAEWPATPDGDFHLQRTRALAEAYSQGVLYPRWFPDFAFGYGHPILHYYAPGSYVLPALLSLLRVDLLIATRIALAVNFGLSGACCYWALRLFAARPAAFAAALIYLAFPYRLYDLMVRGALPEFAAFLWLPLLFAAALWAYAKPQQLALAGLLGALTWAGLALTHNLTTLMAASLLVAALPVVVWRGGWRAGVRVLLAPAIGALLSAFYTVPVLLEASWVGIGSAPGAAGYANHFASWRDLAQWGLTYRYPAADEPTVPLPGYVTGVAALGLLVALLVRSRRLVLLAGLAGLALTVWLTSGTSALLWDASAPVLGKLQFPWRLHTVLAIPLVILVALLLSPLRAWAAWPLALALGVAAIFYAWPPAPAIAVTPIINRTTLWSFDATSGQIGATWTGEFLPRWVNAPRWSIGRAAESPPEPTAPVTTNVQATHTGHYILAYLITAPETTTITLDRFYFPAWRVTVNGEPVETRPVGELGLLGVTVPAGISFMVVTWSATPAVQLGRVLSGVGWLAVAALIWVARGQGRPALFPRGPALALWLLVGLFGLLTISQVTQRVHEIPPLILTYRAVQLSGAIVPPVRRNTDTVDVTLFWSVRSRPMALTVFVHVLDRSGRVVAQWDEPLGGPYRPPDRLAPGLLMRQTVTVPLTLEAGDYRVTAGLYPSGTPQSPLWPVGTRQTRIPLGTLEVRP